MCSNKIYVRGVILDKKKEFNRTSNNEHVIEAAVVKGIYNGIGGTMAIPLPGYCGTIVNTVKNLSSLKYKSSGDIIKDLNKLISSIRCIDCIGNIKLHIREDTTVLQLGFKGEVKDLYISIKLPLKDDGIAYIATKIIENSSSRYNFGVRELQLINRTTESYLQYVDRGLGYGSKG